MNDSANKLDVEDCNGKIYQVDFLEIQKATFILRVLNNKIRQGIFRIILDYGTLTVSEIQFKLNLERREIDEHLGVLRRANFVRIERIRNVFYYSINEQRINNIQSLIFLNPIS